MVLWVVCSGFGSIRRGSAGLFGFLYFFIIIASLLSVVYPIIGGKVIDDVIYQGKMNWLLPLLFIMIGTTVLRTIFSLYVSNYV